MNFAVTLVGLTLGQPPAITSDYYPMNSRNIKIPIKYDKDPKTIRQVKLCVARNGENTWYQELAGPPDREFFSYVAKEDGVYWFTMVEEDLQGKNIPADLTRTPPDLKVVVDTVQPRVQFTNARRNGDEVLVEWIVEDRNPDDSKTQVHFRAGDGSWQEVLLPAGSRTGVRFPAGTTAPVSVRVTAVDIAGNKSEAFREVAANESPTTTTSMSPGGSAATNPPLKHASAAGPLAPPDLGPLAPPAPPGTPVTPPAGTPNHTRATAPNNGTETAPNNTVATPPNIAATPPAAAVPPTAIPPNAAGSAAGGAPTAGMTPLPTVDPKVPLTQPPAAGGPQPVAVWSGAPTRPTVEVSRAQSINYLAFDLGYEVETRGPSGISRLDLWVTRDDGKTWMKWSQHDAKGASVRVNLNVPGNPQPEGTYGFRVVPVSGAGLSEREPVAGDGPDLRVVVDVTPPQLDLFPAVGDPARPDTLVIQWKATDRNFGDDPITIEWSDKPTGPWQPAAASGDVMQAGAGGTPQVRRVGNTGSFPWRVPAGVAPRVYLKVTARDAAGNLREAVTRDPILVDLVKPKAKISGIVAPAGGDRP